MYVVVRRQQTTELKALAKQVARYKASGNAFNIYIDGALLIRDSSHPTGVEFGCRWWNEYNRPDSSDRDQFRYR